MSSSRSYTLVKHSLILNHEYFGRQGDGREEWEGGGMGTPQNKTTSSSICPSTGATDFHEVENLMLIVQDNKCVVILVRNLLLPTKVDSDVRMIKWNRPSPFWI